MQVSASRHSWYVLHLYCWMMLLLSLAHSGGQAISGFTPSHRSILYISRRYSAETAYWQLRGSVGDSPPQSCCPVLHSKLNLLVLILLYPLQPVYPISNVRDTDCHVVLCATHEAEESVTILHIAYLSLFLRITSDHADRVLSCGS